MRPIPVVVGERFGRLTIIGAMPTREGHSYVKCRCDCGNEAIVKFAYIRTGHTKSCGCQRERALRAGRDARSTTLFSYLPEYAAWHAMKIRCYLPSCRSYKHYGARGIQVCEKWRHSFKAFLDDVGHRPSTKHSIDRIDNNGHYEPGNVRWATSAEQNANTRRTDLITHDGLTLPLNTWANRVGISQGTLWRRIHELRWTTAKALTHPPRLHRHH